MEVTVIECVITQHTGGGGNLEPAHREIPGMVGLPPKWIRLDPKLDKSNLTHFGAKPTIPGRLIGKSCV